MFVHTQTSSGRLDRIKQVVPLDWRYAARRWLLNEPGAPYRGPAARPNVFARGYDRISASRVGNLKSAVPIEWRIATRRWLSKAGR